MRFRRLHFFLVGLTFVVGSTLLPAQAANAHLYWRHCGSQNHLGAGWYHVRAHKVRCYKARHVARKWTNRGGPRYVTIDDRRFRCHQRQISYETVRVRCASKGDRIVKFHFGS